MRICSCLLVLAVACHPNSRDAIDVGVIESVPQVVSTPDLQAACQPTDVVVTGTRAIRGPWEDDSPSFAQHVGTSIVLETSVSSYVVSLDGDVVDVERPGLRQLSSDCTARRYAYDVEVDGDNETLRFTSHTPTRSVSNRTANGWMLVVEDVAAAVRLNQNHTATVLAKVNRFGDPVPYAVSSDGRTVLFYDQVYEWLAPSEADITQTHYRWRRSSRNTQAIGSANAHPTSTTTAGFNGITYSADGTTIAIGSNSFTPYSSFGGRTDTVYRGVTRLSLDDVYILALSSDGRWLAFRENGRLNILDVDSGESFEVPQTDTDFLWDVTFVGAGETIAGLSTGRLYVVPNPAF